LKAWVRVVKSVTREINPVCKACRGAVRLFGRQGAYRYVLCRECGSLQLDPFPSKEIMERMYRDDYASAGHYNPDPIEALRLGSPYYEELSDIITKADLPDGRILDFGCGWGGLCTLLKEKGLDYLGVDISKEEVEYCRQKGLHVIQSDLDMLETTGQRFAAIATVSVLEHLIDHEKFMETLNKMLLPGGIFIASTPTAPFATFVGNWVMRMKSGELATKPFDPPWHTVLFSPEGIRRLSARHHLYLEKVLPSRAPFAPGVLGMIRPFATVFGKAGFILFGEKWPVVVSHIFICRKPRA